MTGPAVRVSAIPSTAARWPNGRVAVALEAGPASLTPAEARALAASLEDAAVLAEQQADPLEGLLAD